MSDNGATLTRDELAAEAYRLKTLRYTRAQIAQALREHYTGKQPEPTTGWATSLLRHHERVTAAQYGVQEYSYSGKPPEVVRLPIYDSALTVEWERCIVVGDVHLPTTDFAFADVMLKVARKRGIRKLYIGGDLFNMDAYSKYEHLVPPPTFGDEHAVAVRMLARWAEQFDEMVLIRGNHEDRLIKHSNGNISFSLLGSLISAAKNNLRMSPYAFGFIISGGQKWLVAHQKEARKNPGGVARELVLQYGCNVISFHQHHVSQHIVNARHVAIDGGGLFDVLKMAYVSLNISVKRPMAQGFVVLEHGTASLVTPYPAMTNMARWLGEEART